MLICSLLFLSSFLKLCVMLKLQYVVSLQFGKHTITQASVYHYALPCVTADTDL